MAGARSDGDGIRSSLSLAVAPDEGLSAQVAKTMTKKDVEE